MNFTSESVMHDIEVALKERSNEDWSDTDRLLLKAQLHIASLQRQLDHKELTDESEKTENKTITREQIVLWAYEAGFPTNYVRGEVVRFETFARLVQKHLERDYK